jgi:hypothetical protein
MLARFFTWTQMKLRYDSWTHLGVAEETFSLIIDWVLPLSLLKYQTRKIQVSMSHHAVRCHVQNGMWSENWCPALPGTETPPSQVCWGTLSIDIRLLWFLSKGDGATLWTGAALGSRVRILLNHRAIYMGYFTCQKLLYTLQKHL